MQSARMIASRSGLVGASQMHSPLPNPLGRPFNRGLAGVTRQPHKSPKLLVQPSTLQYSTLPNSDQVAQTFSTPLSNFLFTISRVARIILFTSVGIVTVGAATFESVHQYVEHVALPRSQAQGQEEDGWGWLQENQEENWGNGKGTDKRLGFRGRHTLRAAWISANWGGGISPSSLISAGSGGPTLGGKRASTASFVAEEGLEKAEGFLKETLDIAEEKGIRIPDLAAMRAGIHTPEAAEAASKPLEWTAVSLECKLASIRERLGTTEALKGALSGYTRVYDVLSHVDATNRAMKGEGHDSGRQDIRTDRLVRLATKVGDLHAELGHRNEAEDWLLHAVSLAGQSAHEAVDNEARQSELRSQIMHGVGGLAHTPEEAEEAQAVAKGNLSKQLPLHTPLAMPELLSSETPSPALTRSFISTLLSLSAFYARPDDHGQLERALQFQASALRLARVEKQRLSLLGNKADTGPSLHALWLAHHDAVASIHIAETLYALRSRSVVSSLSSGLMSSLGFAAKHDKSNQTMQWLDEADVIAKATIQQLAKNSKRLDEPTSLQPRWKAHSQCEVPAQRLLRDSLRLRTTIEEMKKAL
jgi:hypothetical protein